MFLDTSSLISVYSRLPHKNKANVVFKTRINSLHVNMPGLNVLVTVELLPSEPLQVARKSNLQCFEYEMHLLSRKPNQTLCQVA